MSDTLHRIEFSRNYGFYSEAEQEALAQSVVSIAGAGGDGFQLGYKLAMNGVGEIRVADPETFEAENSNRVFAATKNNVGRNKAEVFKEMAESLPSQPKIVVYKEGVNEDNVDEFTHGADLILDESELRYLHIGTMLSREAVKKSIPELLVMNVGFAGVATSFKPSKGKTFEKLMGIPKGMPLDEVAELEVDFARALPYLPPYGDHRTLLSVQKGASLPSISQGVDMASAIGSTEAVLHLTSMVKNHRKSPVWAPRYRYMDAYTNKSGVKHMPRTSYYLSAAAMMARSYTGRNPKADYTLDDIRRRSAA